MKLNLPFYFQLAENQSLPTRGTENWLHNIASHFYPISAQTNPSVAQNKTPKASWGSKNKINDVLLQILVVLLYIWSNLKLVELK